MICLVLLASTPLAHCVSSDFRMGAGIALEFKKKIGGVQVLNKHKTPGDVAFIKFKGRYIYYFDNKKKSLLE